LVCLDIRRGLGVGLGHSARKVERLSQVVPSIVFVAALILSMLGLSFALKTLPLGTSYAVWVGIGAMLTVVYGMLTGEESVSAVKVVLIAGLVACIVGLKAANGETAAS